MGDSTVEPKEFQIKLRYRVGSEIHYTTLDKFEFLTIRDTNMIDKEKTIVKKKMEDKGKIWNNIDADFKELKNHLEAEDGKNYKFNIPLSTYYFTFDNLQSFINQKASITSSDSTISKTDIYNNIAKINDYLSKNEFAKKVDEYIKTRVDRNDETYFFKFNNEKEGDLSKLFNIEVLQKSKYLNKNNQIGEGKHLIYRFLYFIFYVDLEEYFKLPQTSLELDLVNDEKLLEPQAKEFLEESNKEKIVIIKTLQNIKILLHNLSYLNGLYNDYNTKRILSKESIPKIKTLKKIGKDAVGKLLPSYRRYPDKFNDSNQEPFMIFELFPTSGRDLKFKFIEDIIGGVIKDIETQYTDVLQSQEKAYKEFEQNKSKLFIIPQGEDDKKKYIKQYFQFLEENFKENDKYKKSRSLRIERAIPEHNTEEKRKEIVKEYGKYIIGDEYYENIDKLYSTLRTDQRTLSYIITYYNIFEILKTLFLVPNNCILHNKFFTQIINQQDGQNKIKKSKEKMYVKVKSINCIKYTKEMLRASFENDVILKPYYEIEFEEIPTYSNIIFYINFIDRLDPKKQLEYTIKNYKDEFSGQKKTIADINSKTLIYRTHSNDMFSKNKNINKSNNKIFVKKDLDIKKMVNTFSIIKSNNKIFKSLEVEKERDALMISDTFNAIINEKELKNESLSEDDFEDYIFNYYIERFYFEIDEHLFVDGKYAQIKKVKLRLLNTMSYDELRNNQLDLTKEKERFLGVSPSATTRLAIDSVGSSYYVYLDVDVVYKNSPTDRIPIKDQINYGNDCIGKATVLDRLLYFQLGLNYPRRYLENKLRKKNTSSDSTRKKSLVKSITSAPKTEKSQTGGTNKNLTRKIISKQKNKTMKNLVHYYTI
tara:strand:- start:7035 stop:9662 length:2628 start_codon:yes stop_codon:yes gene_type:complete